MADISITVADLRAEHIALLNNESVGLWIDLAPGLDIDLGGRRADTQADATAMDKLAVVAAEAARELRGDNDPTSRPGDLYATASGHHWFGVDVGGEDGQTAVYLTAPSGDILSPEAVRGLYGELTLIHRQPAAPEQAEDGGQDR